MSMALINGGNVRDYTSDAWNNLTLSDLYAIFPFGNTLEVVYLKGAHIWEAFEHSVSDYSVLNPPGKFLQVSGIQVVYDLR